MHTQTPWYVGQTREWGEDGKPFEQLVICNCSEQILIATVETWIGERERQESEDNAQFIVKAVNSYEVMKEALRKALSILSPLNRTNDPFNYIGSTVAVINEALAVAEGKEI